MLPTRLRFLASVLATLLAAPFPVVAFDSPLSDTAVREAYFLGQRRDDSLGHFFDKYTKHLPPAKSGPSISKITFLTPFALLVQFSNQHASGYSAQQAQIDHRNSGELVRVVIEFDCANMANSGTYNAAGFHPYAFWKDFDFQISDKDQLRKPLTSSADPNYVCGDDGCLLIGVTLTYDFSPESFTTDTATVRVVPPEADPFDVSFDLSALR